MVKTKLVASVLLAIAFGVNADPVNDMEMSRSKAIHQGKTVLGDDFINSLIATREASIAKADEMAVSVSVEQQSFTPEHSTEETFVILISDSMGESALKQLFSSLAHRGDVQFVIRGLLPTEKTITDAGMRIIKLVKDITPTPNVTLDPRYFKEVQAELAPQILMYQGNELVLRASGLTNPNYMREQFEAGQRGDLGKLGNTVSISEKDLTEIIIERASKLNSEQIIADAKNRYWDKVEYTLLPEAVETQVREFVPQVIVNEDITSLENKIIAYQGQTFNPLNQLPFTQRLVIFDATNPAHIEFVKTLPVSDKRTKLITTRFDSSLKWDAVKTVERELGAPVFKLERNVVKAFDVRVVPSVITADNERKVFLISETNVEEVYGNAE